MVHKSRQHEWESIPVIKVRFCIIESLLKQKEFRFRKKKQSLNYRKAPIIRPGLN
jgi:hypothetical protein